MGYWYSHISRDQEGQNQLVVPIDMEQHAYNKVTVTSWSLIDMTKGSFSLSSFFGQLNFSLHGIAEHRNIVVEN